MQMQTATVSSGNRAIDARPGYFPFVSNGDIDDGLNTIGTVVSIPQGRELYAEGDPAESWYQVRSGVLRTCKFMLDGRRQIDSFLLPGDFFGFEALSEHRFGAEAITPATVIRYSRSRIEALADGSPGLSRRLREIALKSLSDVQRRLVLLGRKTAEERLTSFILEMLDRSPEHDAVELAMSRNDIADYLGLTIETVSRTFSALKREGILALPNAQRIAVRDRDVLESLSGGE